MSTDLVKLASAPIHAENPAGKQMTADDPDFDRVNTEILQINLHGLEGVDWGEVVGAGTAILTQKSKDLKIASYFCMGLFQEQGYSGLSMGLEIYINLLDNFWETLYPERIKGRIGAVEWLSDRVAPAVARKEPAADEAKAVQACVEHAEKLIQIVDEKFGNGAPSLAALRKAIQTYAAKMKVEEPPADGEQAKQPSAMPIAQTEMEKSPQATSKREQAGQPSATPIVPPQMEITSEADARRLILRAVAFLRESQPTDSLPYRLSRVTVWHPITLPSANNGKTRIAGILPQMVQGFQNLLDSAQWDKLLRQAEARFPDSPLWLDLQRFIDYAMEGLGEAYQDARQVVREELGALVQRLPEIVELQFQNGIPFADDRTKMWIDTEVLPSVETTASTEVVVKAFVPVVEGDAPSDDGRPDQVVAEARRLTAGGKFKDAVSLLLEGLASASMRREQFLWKLRLAKLCLEAGYPRLALPQLQSLDDEIRQFSLEQWEPNLSVEVVRTLLQSQRKLMQDAKCPPAEIVERTNELYGRLCRLDVLSAVALDGGS